MTRSAHTATSPLAKVALSIALLMLVLGTLNPGFYQRLGADVFFSLALAGFAVVFLSISARPGWDSAQLAVLSAFLVGLQMWVLRVPFKPVPALAMLGMGALLLIAIRRIWSQGERARFLHYALVPPFLLVLAGYWGSTLLGITGTLHPRTFDLFLYNFDQSLGVQLSCRIGQIVLPSHWQKATAVGLYYALPLTGMFVYSRQLLRERNFALTAFLAFLIAGPVGIIFYNMVPACGPICFLGSRFPFNPPTLLQLAHLPLQREVHFGPRNAFPSLHLGWALLAWWYSAGLSWRARFPVLVFLIATAVAILALGEHYFIDLIAAFPFALMIEAGCALQLPLLARRRIVPFLMGLSLLLGWVGLLRRGLRPDWTNPVVAWMLIVLTVALSLFLHSRLHAAVLQASSFNPKAGVTDSHSGTGQ
jgi:hypothetical protein